MTDKLTSERISAVPTLVGIAVVLLCLPATLYAAATWVLQILPRAFLERETPMPALGHFMAFCFFLVAFMGRPMCAIAILLGIVLFFLRGAPIWLKFLAFAVIVFAVLGTGLVESQAAHVRH